MQVFQKLKGARKILYYGIPLFMLISSCQQKLHKRQSDPFDTINVASNIIGIYDYGYIRKGVDIPDYTRYSILTLEEDSTFQLRSGGTDEFEENTFIGTWKVSSDTLSIQFARNTVGQSILHYKIKNSNTLLILPLIKDGTPFKKRK